MERFEYSVQSGQRQAERVRRYSGGEAQHKERCGCDSDQVNGPRMVASAYQVEVSRATFIAIHVKAHSRGSV